jgi:hypothetical protein
MRTTAEEQPPAAEQPQEEREEGTRYFENIDRVGCNGLEKMTTTES